MLGFNNDAVWGNDCLEDQYSRGVFFFFFNGIGFLVLDFIVCV